MRVERVELYLRLVESILLNGDEKTLEGGPVPDQLEDWPCSLSTSGKPEWWLYVNLKTMNDLNFKIPSSQVTGEESHSTECLHAKLNIRYKR